MDLADYVLGHFSKEEQATMDDAVKEAADAVCEIVNVGIAQAMNDHNRKKEERSIGKILPQCACGECLCTLTGIESEI